MSKIIAILFTVVILLSLSACSQSDAAKAADSAIESIGTVSLDSLSLIEEAETMVNDLSEEDYKSLKNIDALAKARTSFEALLIDDLINKIGDVTVDSQKAIELARNAYEKASESVKSSVINYDILENAEAVFDGIIYNEKVLPIEKAISSIGTVNVHSDVQIEAARKKYDNADKTVQELVSNYDTLTEAEAEYERIAFETEVNGITEAIDNIGTVTLDSHSKIVSARKKYDSANQAVQKTVTNYAALVAAESEYERLETDKQAQSVIDAINSIGSVSLNSITLIQNIEAEYKGLSDTAKAKVSNYAVLESAKVTYSEVLANEYNSALSRVSIDTDDIRRVQFYMPDRMPYYNNTRCAMLPYIGLSAKDGSNWMLLRFNYAGDNWVFFKQATIAVDEERYYHVFNYFDITHDNAGGMVGEIIDINVSDKDIAMLREIVTSNNTVVRFEGDDHYYDYTLEESDKSAIKDILIIYDYLNK